MIFTSPYRATAARPSFLITHPIISRSDYHIHYDWKKSGWKVGLTSIALPDTKALLLFHRVHPIGVPNVLFKVNWIRTDGRGGHTNGNADFQQ